MFLAQIDFPNDYTQKQIHRYCYFTVGLVVIVFILAHVIIPRINQVEGYHNYADQRFILGIPFFFNVLSNIPFLLVGILGMHLLWFGKMKEEKIDKIESNLYAAFFFFIFIGGFGSGFYHLDPTNFTLLFDRLPLSATGMSLLSAIIAERISPILARNLFFPLILFSALATCFWGFTESQGAGDIRAYAFVNFLPALFIPITLLFFPKDYSGTKYFVKLVIFFFISRVAETLDKKVFALTFHLISGHTIKHLTLGFAVFQIYLYLKNRQLQSPSLKENALINDNSENV
uniref:Alkaline phytoceramidase n=1 Tax=Panagrolaimus superbus TaxID=310955 RepID=A0A914YSQ7_9BILA